MSTTISKGKFHAGYAVLMLALNIGLFTLSFYLFQNAFAFQFLQIDHLIAAVIFTSLFAYFIFKGMADYKAVDVHEGYLQVKWLFGLLRLKLLPSDIAQFGESSVKDTGYIYLRTRGRDLLFNVSLMDNDVELIEQLRAWRIKRKDNNSISEFSKFEGRVGNVLLKIVGAFLCTVVLYSSYVNVWTPIERGSLVPINGRLKNQPAIDHSTIKSPSKGISFSLSEYPAFRFTVGQAGYNVTNRTDLKGYGVGTKATFWIKKEQYQMKIANKSDPEFSNKHFDWNRITIYEAELNGHKVLDLNQMNEEAAALKANDQKWGWAMCLILAFAFFGGWKLFR